MPSTSETIAPKKAYVLRAKPRTLEPHLLDNLLNESWTPPIEDDWSIDSIQTDEPRQQLRSPTGEATAQTSCAPLTFRPLGETVRLMKQWVASNPSITSRVPPLAHSRLQILGLSGSPVLASSMQNVTALYSPDVGAEAQSERFARMLVIRPDEALFSFDDLWKQRSNLVGTALLQTGVPTFAAALELRLAEIPNMAVAADSVLPNRDVLNAARQVASYLPVRTRVPEIEIDDSTGSISLIWRDESRENSFSLEIPSARYVVGIGLGERFSNAPPWRHLVSDERRIIAEIQSSAAAQALMKSA